MLKNIVRNQRVRLANSDFRMMSNTKTRKDIPARKSKRESLVSKLL